MESTDYINDRERGVININQNSPSLSEFQETPGVPSLELPNDLETLKRLYAQRSGSLTPVSELLTGWLPGLGDLELAMGVGLDLMNKNYIGAALGVGAFASESGVPKTVKAFNEGRYADAALSGMGDLWNGFVTATGINNFINLAKMIGSQIPIHWLKGDDVIFDPRHPVGLFYMNEPYGVPAYLPEAAIPGGVGAGTRVYVPPVRSTGVNSPYGQTYWMGTTLPVPVRIQGTAPKGSFPAHSSNVETPFIYSASSTLPPVPGMPIVPPMVPPVIPPPILVPPVKIPPYPEPELNYSAEVYDPGFIRWWREHDTPENQGLVLYYNGIPILMRKDPRVWANDATNERVSPNYLRDYGDYGDYTYQIMQNGRIIPEDDSTWIINEAKRKVVEDAARSSGVYKIRSK